MKVEHRDSSPERRILTAMILDAGTLGMIAPKWNKELFQSPAANTVGDWCVTYFNQYGKAPGKAIESMFESWSRDHHDKETIQLVESLLDGLSREYTQNKNEINTAYMIDTAAKHFNRVRATKFKDAIEGDLVDGDIDKVQRRINEFSKVQIGVGSDVDVLRDPEAIREAFQSNTGSIIKFPEAAGNFFTKSYERDSFVAIMAPEKRGKSFFLLDLAWRSMSQKMRTAYFEVGDMSQNQVMRRLMVRASRRPLSPGPVLYPIELKHELDDGRATIVHERREFEKPLGWKTAWRACQKIFNQLGVEDSLLRLSCHPNSTMSVRDIRSKLRTWDRLGWTPDVIVIDYADILAPPPGMSMSRDAINATWMELRSMSQDLHCVVVTATQADAASYTAESMDMTNFSEDKRKYGHVTGMFCLDQSGPEKDQDIVRMKWLCGRDLDFSKERFCFVAGCRAICNPIILSTF